MGLGFPFKSAPKTSAQPLPIGNSFATFRVCLFPAVKSATKKGAPNFLSILGLDVCRTAAVRTPQTLAPIGTLSRLVQLVLLGLGVFLFESTDKKSVP